MGDYKENEVENLERVYTDVNAKPIQVPYSVVKSITKNFAQVIGQGGFGVVYLGGLKNGLVAVKKLSPSKDFSDAQFLKEVKCLEKVNHKNIVRFLGYCAETQGLAMEIGGNYTLVEVQQRLLCFEYVPNGSLHNYLQEKTHGYEWNTRYRIIKGICQGLYYLHHQLHINHLDLKPANVLLGAQMEPKITDFGLSRCMDVNQSTIFTNNLWGTPGYIAPEYIDERKISSKSDIFSLGIIMTRLLTGSNDIISENWHELLNVDSHEMKRCIEIAQICTDHDPSKRPAISEIICQLDEIETTRQKVPDLVVSEPRHDPATTLYQVVERFWTLPSQTSSEYHRGPEKPPVERPKWKLAFKCRPKLPILTGQKIEDANGNPLEVILMDADTGEPSAPPPKALQIELVPLLGNFPRDCWDADDFRRGIVEDLEEKCPLLAGQCTLTMWDRRATVNQLIFTEGSLKCGCMFRIGVRVMPGSYHGARILEAMTVAFMVRDRQTYELHQNKGYKWQLAFQSQPQLPIYVGRKITDVIGNPIEVTLVDTETGGPLAQLPMEELDIELVLLDDELVRMLSERKDWSSDDAFEVAVLRDQSILSGDIRQTMKNDGRITVGDLQFTAECRHSRVRMGVRIVSSGYSGPGRILEAMSHALDVRRSPTEVDTKRYPPALRDEVWRLEGISWGGEFHKRLEQCNIRNVEDFLRMLAVKPEELRAIMGQEGMEDDDDSTWAHITRHARTCVIPVDKVYAHSVAVATIYVNSIFDLVKVEFGGTECPLQQLDEAQKRLVQQVMLEAYEQRHNLKELKLTLKLAFKRQPRLPIYVMSSILDTTGNPLEIILVDTNTGSPWALQMDLCIGLDLLLGDFPPYTIKDDWSAQEFQAAVVEKPCGHYVQLLQGYQSNLIMRDGRITLTDLWLTEDSSWVRCRKFRIGAHVWRAGNSMGEFRIVEAMTEPFEVINLKHYPPALDDPVWRLDMIDRDGAVHRKLTSNSLDTVQELCRVLNVKYFELQAMLGDGITGLKWSKMTDHADTCDRGDKMYAYSGANGTVYVDSVFFRGLFKMDIDTDERLMDKAKTLILEAYEHRHNLLEVSAGTKLRADDNCYIFEIRELLLGHRTRF